MRLVIALLLLCLFPAGGFAQTLDDRLEALEKAMKSQEQSIQELKTLQKTVKQQEQTIDDQRRLIEQLKAEIKRKEGAGPAATASTAAPASDQVRQEVRDLKEKVDEVAEAQKKDVLSAFNPSIGLVGDTVFGYRTKGSHETGSDRPGGFDANMRSVELDLAAAVDPFAKAYAVLNASADPVTGDATFGVEEAAIQTTSLPWNLEVKAGRFFGEFGRLAYVHDHELPFVNRPLVLDQYIGGESRTDGVQVNYLVPIPHYLSLTLGVGNNFGDAPDLEGDLNNGDYRPFGGLSFWGRTSTYFDLTPNTSLETGVSGLWNPKAMDRGGVISQPDGSTFNERERRLFGADFVVSYKPLSNNQFQALTWGTEVLFSNNRYDIAGSPEGDLYDHGVDSYGLYSYLAYRFHRQWSAGFLFDWVENAQDNRDQTFAYSPFITWNMSHWSQLRLQYTHTDHNAYSALRPDDAVYLQWSWIIGSHSHGWQQR